MVDIPLVGEIYDDPLWITDLGRSGYLAVVLVSEFSSVFEELL